MDRRADQSIEGPRPTPLKISQESHKIRKPPAAPQSTAMAPALHHPPRRPPVIKYAVTPKVIHTSPTGFMSLVQRLTGLASTTTSHAGPDTVLEKTKMPMEENGMGPGGFTQGILSPRPAGLPRPVPDSFFSDPSGLVDLYRQQNGLLHQEYFNTLHQHLQDGGVLGGTGVSGGGIGDFLASPSVGAFLSPNQMLSPVSVELLRKLLEQ